MSLRDVSGLPAFNFLARPTSTMRSLPLHDPHFGILTPTFLEPISLPSSPSPPGPLRLLRLLPISYPPHNPIYHHSRLDFLSRSIPHQFLDSSFPTSKNALTTSCIYALALTIGLISYFSLLLFYCPYLFASLEMALRLREQFAELMVDGLVIGLVYYNVYDDDQKVLYLYEQCRAIVSFTSIYVQHEGKIAERCVCWQAARFDSTMKYHDTKEHRRPVTGLNLSGRDRAIITI